jgi:ABC-type sulfate/molybdate transport systems ATPase subunit
MCELLQAEDLRRRYPQQNGAYGGIDGVSFKVKNGEWVGIIGKTGSGKSTLLRVVAGTEPCDSGEGHMLLNGVPYDPTDSEARKALPAILVWQELSLFNHMRVEANLRFAHECSSRGGEDFGPILDDLISSLDLELRWMKRFPQELSGGEQQRVALARSLAAAPKVLLLDEPFRHQDPEQRQRLISSIRTVYKPLIPFGFIVSHDHGDVFQLADIILIMDNGKMVASGRSTDLISTPPTSEFAKRIGDNTLIGASFDRTSLTATVVALGKTWAIRVAANRVHPLLLCGNSKSAVVVIPAAAVRPGMARGASQCFDAAVSGFKQLTTLPTGHVAVRLDSVLGPVRALWATGALAEFEGVFAKSIHIPLREVWVTVHVPLNEV